MNFTNTLLIAGLAIVTTACHKGQVPPDGIPVKLSYTFTNGPGAFNPEEPIVDGLGRTVWITKFKFYAHDVRLLGSDGNAVTQAQDSILFVDMDAATNELALGTMQPAQLSQVELAYGLNDQASYGYPDQVAAPYPLNVADMTWMWNTAAGRVFVKLEGFVDENANDTLDEGEGFQYHAIGAALEPERATVPYAQSIVLGAPFTIRLNVDMAALVSTLGLDGVYHDDGPQTQRLLENLADATVRL